MKIKNNEILFIYNSESIEDRRALGYAKSLKHHNVRVFDIQTDRFTETQLEEIVNFMDIDPKELIDVKSDTFQKEYANVDLTREGVISVLSLKPKLMRTPIAIYQDRSRFVGSAYEFIKEDMANVGVIGEFQKG